MLCCFPRYREDPDLSKWINCWTKLDYIWTFRHGSTPVVLSESEHCSSCLKTCRTTIHALLEGLDFFMLNIRAFQHDDSVPISDFFQFGEQWHFAKKYIEHSMPYPFTDDNYITAITEAQQSCNKIGKELDEIERKGVVISEDCPETRKVFKKLYDLLMIPDNRPIMW